MPSAVISSRRTPSSANNFASAAEPPSGIDNGTRGLRPGNVPDRQLRIIGKRRSDADDDNVDQRAQAVQMLDTGRTVDILRMTRRRRHPAIEGLPELTDDNEIVDRPVP